MEFWNDVGMEIWSDVILKGGIVLVALMRVMGK